MIERRPDGEGQHPLEHAENEESSIAGIEFFEEEPKLGMLNRTKADLPVHLWCSRELWARLIYI